MIGTLSIRMALRRIIPSSARRLLHRLTGARLRRLMKLLPATTSDAIRVWVSRGQNDSDLEEWAATYMRSIDRPYRAELLKAVSRLEPLASVYEFGCHIGPNLYLLASRYPQALIRGVDVNEKIVERARQWLSVFPNVRVESGDLREALARLPSSSVDCVISCYSLACIAPSDVEDTIRHALRVAKRGVVFLEPHGLRPGDKERDNLEWRRNYASIVRSIAPNAGVELVPLPEFARQGALDAITFVEKVT